MKKWEKQELRDACKAGESFEEIRSYVDCCDATIKNYMKVFSPKEAPRK